jgi:predicted KAP-like P-loop ATPase
MGLVGRLRHVLDGPGQRGGSAPSLDAQAHVASEATQTEHPRDDQPVDSTMQADTPLENEVDDRLDRLPFASAVADTIARRSDWSPIVIGIYAPWGDGKTTVLNWIRRRLDNPDAETVVVPFNPWLIRDELTLLPAFFATLATAVGRRMGGRADDIAKVLKRYGGILSGVTFGVPGLSVDPGTAAEAIGSALADRSLEDMKREFERLLREARRRVLVIIDDVDRLDDAEIHAVFKLIKLAGAFEGVTYLLAFDDEKVAAALAKRYSYAATGTGFEGGYDFLEKIVQVPLRLPRARKSAIDEITLEGLQAALNGAQIEISDDDAREFRVRYSQGLSPAITSVRIAKRYANAAAFALPLLKREANAGDVLSIEGINACYPRLYNALREHPSWFLLPYEFQMGDRGEEQRTRRRQRVESVLDAIEPNLHEAARDLLQRVFPQTQSLWSTIGRGDDRAEWAEQQRVCSAEYFDRFFSYAVSASEVSDQELNQTLADPGQLNQRLLDLSNRLGEARIGVLLGALDRRAGKLDPEIASALTRALVGAGPIVSRDRAPRFFELNVSERAARLLAELLLQIPDPGARGAVAAEVIESARPLIFAAECLRWMRLKKSSTDDRRPLDDETVTRLQVLLAGRIASFASELDRPIWREDGGIGLMYRAREAGEAVAMREHVSHWLNQDPTLVASLIGATAGLAYGSMGAIQQDLTTDKYQSLTELADLHEVRAAVDAARGGEAVPTEFPSIAYDRVSSEVADSRLLDQFAWQDHKAEREASSTGEVPDA